MQMLRASYMPFGRVNLLFTNRDFVGRGAAMPKPEGVEMSLHVTIRLQQSLVMWNP